VVEDDGDGRVDVLVVDDDEALRTTMMEILGRAGYSVIDAEDGGAALERLATNHVGVMLLDMQMPGLDGLGVLLRGRGRLPPVIVVSADRFDALSVAPDADVFLFMRKPVPPRELLEGVKMALVARPS
jgi:CheY-like chemotaxis protein